MGKFDSGLNSKAQVAGEELPAYSASSSSAFTDEIPPPLSESYMTFQMLKYQLIQILHLTANLSDGALKQEGIVKARKLHDEYVLRFRATLQALILEEHELIQAWDGNKSDTPLSCTLQNLDGEFDYEMQSIMPAAKKYFSVLVKLHELYDTQSHTMEDIESLTGELSISEGQHDPESWHAKFNHSKQKALAKLRHGKSRRAIDTQARIGCDLKGKQQWLGDLKNLIEKQLTEKHMSQKELFTPLHQLNSLEESSIPQLVKSFDLGNARRYPQPGESEVVKEARKGGLVDFSWKCNKANKLCHQLVVQKIYLTLCEFALADHVEHNPKGDFNFDPWDGDSKVQTKNKIINLLLFLSTPNCFVPIHAKSYGGPCAFLDNPFSGSKPDNFNVFGQQTSVTKYYEEHFDSSPGPYNDFPPPPEDGDFVRVIIPRPDNAKLLLIDQSSYTDYCDSESVRFVYNGSTSCSYTSSKVKNLPSVVTANT